MTDSELKELLKKYGPAGAAEAPTPWINKV